MFSLTDTEISVLFFLFMVLTVAVFAVIDSWVKPMDLPIMRPMPKFPDLDL